MDFKSLMPFGRTPADGDNTFGALQREINRMFDDVWRGHHLPAAFGGNGFLAPRVDVKETPTGLEVTAELPGVDEKEINVELADDTLTIKGEKKLEKDEKKDNFHVMERSYGMFQRVIPLPFAPKPDAVKAEFAKGVLKVSLVRPPEAEAKTQKIAVEAK
ncbi:MAG: Hsp20/alpha crystallin family protein [Ferrovibrio sp.]|uniref:Hsp20/alpha crystallin family protein n=1 Tax=Ferrovibrio sp. TaxID=1917215 RepID=UPI002628BFB0|nr:Hsp20/alpha crystallin family protein [Ferrovibrio sp.]MCW0235812.1 Hsp20/alpha crystallin family protein [Ferrovibrio sp.]